MRLQEEQGDIERKLQLLTVLREIGERELEFTIFLTKTTDKKESQNKRST